MRYLKLTVAYDGSHYVGWQVQPNGVSIQQRLEEAWQRVTQETIRITASGRTDSGVHALGQVCSLQTKAELECRTLRRALNAHTPEDITVCKVQPAPTGFHAIRDASRKTYRYQIQYGRDRDPIERDYYWFCPYELDLAAMQKAAEFLHGEHDFASFQAVGSERPTTVRRLSQLSCSSTSRGGFRRVAIEMTSNGFLYNMVRNIVGTLVKVGQGSESPEWVRWVLEQCNREVAGPTAPPQGLFLLNVEYDGIEFGTE